MSPNFFRQCGCFFSSIFLFFSSQNVRLLEQFVCPHSYEVYSDERTGKTIFKNCQFHFLLLQVCQLMYKVYYIKCFYCWQLF